MPTKNQYKLDPVEIASVEDMCTILYDKNTNLVNLTVYFLNFTLPKPEFLEFAKAVSRGARRLLEEDNKDVV